MANASQRARYALKRKQTTQRLKRSGRAVSFGNRHEGGTNYNPSREYREEFESFIFPLKVRQDFSVDVQSDDLMFFVEAENDISCCRIMVDGGIEYKIIKIEPFMPDDLVIFYEIQVRG